MSVCPTLPSSTSPPFEARFIVASTNLLAVLHHRQPPASLLSSDGYQLLDPTSPPSSSAPAPDTHSTLPDRSIISSIAASRAVDLIAFVRVAPASHRIVTIATLDRSHSLDLDLDHSTASSVHLHWHPALPVLLVILISPSRPSLNASYLRATVLTSSISRRSSLLVRAYTSCISHRCRSLSTRPSRSITRYHRTFRYLNRALCHSRSSSSEYCSCVTRSKPCKRPRGYQPPSILFSSSCMSSPAPSPEQLPISSVWLMTPLNR